MVAKIRESVNFLGWWAGRHENDIILAIGVFLISLASFGAGYLMAKEDLKEPLRIETEPAYEITTEQ